MAQGWRDKRVAARLRAAGWAMPPALGGVSPFVRIAERLTQDKAWRVASVPCGHDVMVDMAAELAKLLVAVSA